MTTISINSANATPAHSKFDLHAALDQLKAFLVTDTQPVRKAPVARAVKAPVARRWNAVSIECDSFLKFTRG
jgi:hypothetical protein